jgi:hypothetical protein
MKNIPKLQIWLAPLLLLSGLLLAPGVSALARDAKALTPVMPAQYDEETEAEAPAPGYRGALEIRCQSEEGRAIPPVEMVLSNPFGETTGYDPRYQTAYQEIPGASYKREVVPGSPETEAEVLTVRHAVSGTYSLRVIGVDYGTYSLFLKGFDKSGSHADVQFTRARIKPGYIHHYRIRFSNREGPSLEVKRTLITE